MDATFILSHGDSRPMYLQIIEQIRLRISVGDWPPGRKLPSIRELAVAAKVSVITVKRAYQELEQAGIIRTQHGKGSFVAEIDDLSTQLLGKDLNEHFEAAIGIGRSLNMSNKEIKVRFQTILESGLGKDRNSE